MVPTPSSDDPLEATNPESTWTIDGGLDVPWPEAVLAAVDSLRQGDLVRSPPFVYYAHGAHPLYGLTREWAASRGSGPGSVAANEPSARPPFGVITTHTCDLVEEARPDKPRRPKRPWVQVAPVYFLRANAGDARAIREGRRYDYLVWMSALGEHDNGVWVADLRISVPVEKGWLVGRDHRAGFVDPDGASSLSSRIARLATRPAYPLPLNDRVLHPLADRLQLLCNEFPAADGIDKVCLELGYRRDDPEFVRLIFIGEAPIPGPVQRALLTWWTTTFADDQPEGLLVVEPEFTTYDALTVQRFRRFDSFDISRLSPPTD